MHKVLVTGVGGGVGQSIIKALEGTDYECVGVDTSELATGLHAVPIAYTGPCAHDSRFVEQLMEICLKEQCKLVFPGLDFELPHLAESSHIFVRNGIIPVISNSDVVKICDDKLATYRFLNHNGFSAPLTEAFSDNPTMDFPFIIKPQIGGSHSMNTYLVRNKHDFDIYRQLIDPDNCVLQEYIEGHEYTCGTVTLYGDCFGVILMRRVLRSGDTYKAFVERNEEVENYVRQIVDALKPFGGCNVQLRIRNGIAMVFEINARCSGTTYARTLAGFNEPKIIADYLLKGMKSDYQINEISIMRYWKELVVSNNRIQCLRDYGSVTGAFTKL